MDIGYAFCMDQDDGVPQNNHFTTVVRKKADVDDGDMFRMEKFTTWKDEMRLLSFDATTKYFDDEQKLEQKLMSQIISMNANACLQEKGSEMRSPIGTREVEQTLARMKHVKCHNDLVKYLRNFNSDLCVYGPSDLGKGDRLTLLRLFYDGVDKYYVNNPVGLYLDPEARLANKRRNRKKETYHNRSVRDEVQTALLGIDFTSHHPVRMPEDKVGPPLSLHSAQAALCVAMDLSDPMVRITLCREQFFLVINLAH